jgi:hypothetical protein
VNAKKKGILKQFQMVKRMTKRSHLILKLPLWRRRQVNFSIACSRFWEKTYSLKMSSSSSSGVWLNIEDSSLMSMNELSDWDREEGKLSMSIFLCCKIFRNVSEIT